MHSVSIVQLVGALRNAVQLLDIETGSKLILCLVDVCNRDDARSVVKLVHSVSSVDRDVRPLVLYIK